MVHFSVLRKRPPLTVEVCDPLAWHSEKQNSSGKGDVG